MKSGKMWCKTVSFQKKIKIEMNHKDNEEEFNNMLEELDEDDIEDGEGFK